jgi:copper resistance protein B
MAAARHQAFMEHGTDIYSMLLINLAEYQVRNGKDGYRWEGEAWYGGNINRLVLKSEGEGTFNGEVEHAEIQALYSRAIDPYFSLQAGARYDVTPGPSRVYATVGVEGLAPFYI